MDLLYHDRTVLITGGASGIGFATLRCLEEAGASGVICDRSDRDRGDSPSCHVSRFDYVQGDIRDEATIQRCLQVLPARGLDALILCAGVGPLGPDPTEIVRVNYSATVGCVLACQPVLAEWSSIALISSTAAYRVEWASRWEKVLEEPYGGPPAGDSWDEIARMPSKKAYALSKWGILRATRRLAHELAPRRVRVNCVIPGPTKTAMSRPLWQDDEPSWGGIVAESPFRTYNPPEDVAVILALLASPLAKMVHGSFIHIDGGWHAVHFRYTHDY